MSLAPFLAVTFGATVAAILARRLPRLSLAIGLLGLTGATIAALAIAPGDRLTIGSADALEATEFARLFLALGCGTGLLLALVGLATSWQRDLPVALLGGFGVLGVGLTIGNPIVSLVAILAGALAGSLVTLVKPFEASDVRIAVREFRTIAVTGAIALIGMAWIARPLGDLAREPAVFGLAYLAVTIAVAIRFGEIPFHLWAARLADSAPEVALPLLLAWMPAAFAVVALTWIDASIASVPFPLGVERGVLVAIGVVSLVLGAVAALGKEDLEHIVGYSIVQDAGFILLGLAALGPIGPEANPTWIPTRIWIIVFVATKTAFAAWAAAMRARFGTRRVAELGGWARRSPMLGVALLLIAIGTIGVPGMVAWEERGRLIDLATSSGPVRLLATLGGLASLLYYGRLALAGLARPVAAVANASGDRPVRWSVAPHERAGKSAAERRIADAESVTWVALKANRAQVAALAVLLLALTSVALGGGWFGIRSAAAAGPPSPGELAGVEGPTAPEPTAPEPTAPGGASAAPQGTVVPVEPSLSPTGPLDTSSSAPLGPSPTP